MTIPDVTNDRQLPLYFLLDCSCGMAGEPIEGMRKGLKTVFDELKSDPMVLQTVFVSLITYGSDAQQVIHRTSIAQAYQPHIEADTCEGASLGRGLELMLHAISNEVVSQSSSCKGDWKAIVFAILGSEPTDDWVNSANELIDSNLVANVVVAVAGSELSTSTQDRMSSSGLKLSNNPGDIKNYFKWITQTI